MQSSTKEPILRATRSRKTAESSNNKVLAFSHLLPHTGAQREKVPHSQPHCALVPQSFRRPGGFCWGKLSGGGGCVSAG